MSHRRRARILAIVMLMAATSLFGIVMPATSQADEATGWPLHLVTNMMPQQMTAFGGDSMSLTNCSNQQQAESFQYIHEGVTASSLPVSTVGTASPPHEGISCGGYQSLATADGTFYTTYVKEDASGVDSLTFVAMKNGRTLWSSDLNSQDDSVCSSMSGWGSEAHDEQMTNASQGSDGNIYGLVQATNPGCATYLTGVSGADGHVLFKQLLTADGSFKASRVWVYDDNILTIDYTGLLREFNYNGIENTSVAYQFPSSIGMFGNAYANADGRVFAVGTCSGSVTDTMLAYHDPNGDNNIATSGLGCNPNVFYTPGANGSLVAYDYSSTATTFQFSTTSITSTSVTVSTPSGVVHVFNSGYWQDQDGNAVMVRQFYTSGWYSAGVSVDEISGSTGAVTNLFFMGVDTDHPAPAVHASDIANGYLYSLICHDSSLCPNTASTNIDGWIHKIPLPGFGTPVKDTGGFATYTSTKLNYVAMGDSFSSGEGTPPFLVGTDDYGYDTCHRSAGAYPELLESNTSLNLNMTGFVPCSGATTQDILNNNQNNAEFAQALALSGQTNVITMSIGGNDVGFGSSMQTCTLINTPTDAQSAANLTQQEVDEQDCMQALNASASALSGTALATTLTNLYNSVESLVPSAKLLVVGYPQLFPRVRQHHRNLRVGKLGV